MKKFILTIKGQKSETYEARPGTEEVVMNYIRLRIKSLNLEFGDYLLDVR